MHSSTWLFIRRGRSPTGRRFSLFCLGLTLLEEAVDLGGPVPDAAAEPDELDPPVLPHPPQTVERKAEKCCGLSASPKRRYVDLRLHGS
jgi:hypothetical protein